MLEVKIGDISWNGLSSAIQLVKLGTDGKIPASELPSLEASIAGGTAFPGTPDNYDLYFKSDEGYLYIYIP